jgi:hypothetical protein
MSHDRMKAEEAGLKDEISEWMAATVAATSCPMDFPPDGGRGVKVLRPSDNSEMK